MGVFRVISYLTLTFFMSRADGLKTYRDMFAHKHAEKFPPIPGWFPDGNVWDDNLYPPFGPRDRLTRGKGKHVSVHLTSNSPAIQGSCVTFTAALEYPKCQKEDASGNLVYEEHCEDSTEASANGQVRMGYVYNWTSWLDDYGFARCLDSSRCNVFPDGRPFPQSNDWRHRSYVYVWHTMGQYYETCSGSSSSLTLNTSGVGLGAGMMEVMVYRTRERRKYTPTASDNGVYFITDRIPLAVNLSQKQAQNLSADVFVKGANVVFDVLLHDPSSYLKTAAAVEFIWDFSDGNQLVTHSNVATHAYGSIGNFTVTLIVKATFPVPCVHTTPTGKPTETHAVTGKVGPTSTATIQKTTATSPVTTAGHPTTTRAMVPTVADVLTALSTTEAPPPTADALKTLAVRPSRTHTTGHVPEQHDSTAPPLLRQRPLQDTECYRYLYGSFQKEILIVDRKLAVQSLTASKIVDVSAAKMSDSTVWFQVKCTGSPPLFACTIVSDALCQQVENIMCDDVPPSPECEVTVKRSFQQPGRYCVNITLQGGAGLVLASTHVTIQPHNTVSTGPQTVEVVLCATSVLLAIFGFIAFIVYRRNKVYRLVRRSPRETEEGGVWLRIRRLGSSPFPANQERSRLLSGGPPL